MINLKWPKIKYLTRKYFAYYQVMKIIQISAC